MKTSNLVRMSLGVLILAAFAACRPLYIPNAVHAPMLTEKNEINADILAGSSGIDAQLAWSPGKHWGVLAGGSYFPEGKEDTVTDHHHIFGEAGAGYHTSFGIGRFDVYGGGGYGFSSTTNQAGTTFGGTSEGNYMRIFVQPSLGIGTDIIDANLAIRTAYVSFSNVKTTGLALENRSSFFVEPALTVRVGYRWIKAFVQVGASLPLSQQLDVQYQPFIVTTGINLNFLKWKNKLD